MYSFWIEQRQSIAFHSQTDRQTGRQKGVLERYFWGYVNYQEDDWTSLLALADFSYNSSIHSSIGKDTFEIKYEKTPRANITNLVEVKKYIRN